MLRDTNVKRTKIRRVSFPGIVDRAAQLRVSRVHLWLVLTGQRESKALLKRYRELVKAEGVKA